jgi:hypothetical protein
MNNVDVVRVVVAFTNERNVRTRLGYDMGWCARNRIAPLKLAVTSEFKAQLLDLQQRRLAKEGVRVHHSDRDVSVRVQASESLILVTVSTELRMTPNAPCELRVSFDDASGSFCMREGSVMVGWDQRPGAVMRRYTLDRFTGECVVEVIPIVMTETGSQWTTRPGIVIVR